MDPIVGTPKEVPLPSYIKRERERGTDRESEKVSIDLRDEKTKEIAVVCTKGELGGE